MALKPTIYKFRIDLSDLDRNRFESLALTVAQHPSETPERMVARVLAFAMNVDEGLAFTKGLCEGDEPDIWLRGLDDRLQLWIEVGEPSADRVRRASRLADRVLVYSFNSKSDTWWTKEGAALERSGAEFFQFAWDDIAAVVPLVGRTTDLSLTLSGDSAYFAADAGEREVHWRALAAAAA